MKLPIKNFIESTTNTFDSRILKMPIIEKMKSDNLEFTFMLPNRIIEMEKKFLSDYNKEFYISNYPNSGKGNIYYPMFKTVYYSRYNIGDKVEHDNQLLKFFINDKKELDYEILAEGVEKYASILLNKNVKYDELNSNQKSVPPIPARIVIRNGKNTLMDFW